MSEKEKSMTVEEHLTAAEELFPDPPKPGEFVEFYKQNLLKAERQILLAQLKIVKSSLK